MCVTKHELHAYRAARLFWSDPKHHGHNESNK